MAGLPRPLARSVTVRKDRERVVEAEVLLALGNDVRPWSRWRSERTLDRSCVEGGAVMAEPMSFPADFSPSDRLMWKIERDPVLRSPVLAVGLLDRVPDRDAVLRTFERASERVPRLRQRVVTHGMFDRRVSWTDDPAFSLDYHVRRVRAPHPADLRTVLDLCAPWSTSVLDPARPQWECTLVEGLEGGRAAFVLKFHHTITDGVGGVDLAGAVFDPRRDGGSDEVEFVDALPRAGSVGLVASARSRTVPSLERRGGPSTTAHGRRRCSLRTVCRENAGPRPGAPFSGAPR